MKVRVLERSPDFDTFAQSKVTRMGPVTEVVTFERRPSGPQCYKVSADTYCDMRTGELKEYKHGDSRADNMDSVRRTLARIRALINCNVTVPENCRWVTLTYRENMTDRERLCSDYEKFWKAFLRWCKREGHEKPDYISIAEPQGRGAWHIHAFFIWSGAAPFVPNNGVMERLWPHGFTKVKAVRASWDNPGAYFTAYLADIPLDELDKLPEGVRGRLEVKEAEIDEDESGIKRKKKFIKGGRLCMYPPGFNIVRHSRGIKEPEVEWMTAGEAKKKVSSAKLTFSRVFEVVDDSGRVTNTLAKEYYNSKRK